MPMIDEEEKSEVLKVLDENALTSAAKNGGKRVRDFEVLLKDFLKVKHVIAVNSGTSALHAAMLATENIKHGDEVLLPSFSFVATANAVIAAGARPIFVDINKRDYTIDICDLERKISHKSRAIIPVHLYGHPSDMDEIAELASKHSLDIIEDACQSLGSEYKKRQTGSFGIMGCFSLYASKVLTSGEGGAIATNSDEIAEKLKMIRNHGMVEGYDTAIFGLNMRLPEISAAIAKVQMKKIRRMLASRRKNAELLTRLLLPLIFDIDNMQYKRASSTLELRIPEETKEKQFNWYLYTISFGMDGLRNNIRDNMQRDKIGVTVYYNPPIHKTPYYEKSSGFTNSHLTNTDWACEHVLSFPVHPMVTEEDIQFIVDSLKKHCDRFLI